MVRQEIRHANFLAFLLNPNATHEFGDILLKSFISTVAADRRLGFSALDVHFMDVSDATIVRERNNIDLLIEIPAHPDTRNLKGIVLAVELKIDAPESGHQLSKYREYVEHTYSKDKWERGFVFLTLDGMEPSQSNQDHWLPMSLSDLIDKFEAAIMSTNASGRAVDLFHDYTSMIRRHLLEDPRLAEVARRIWAKHSAALEFLYEYRPDYQSEILQMISQKILARQNEIKATTGLTLVAQTSTQRILRLGVAEWLSLPNFCGDDHSWVESGAVLLIEVKDRGEGLISSAFVIGPGTSQNRTRLYDAVLSAAQTGKISIAKKTQTLGKWRQLSQLTLQQTTDYEIARTQDKPAEEMAQRAVNTLFQHLVNQLPIYDHIIKDVYTTT